MDYYGPRVPIGGGALSGKDLSHIDRAGAYAVQGLGSMLVERVEGDLSNVIGLPVALLLDLVPGLLDAAGGSRF